MKILLSGLILVTSLLFNSVQADLILTSAPRESKADGFKQYGPLADYLTEQLGEKVRYVQARSWLHYQRDIRQDKYDIILDGPHFISWRMKKHHHTPVAKMRGTLGFYVVVNADDKMETLSDVVNKKLCAIAPPNLSSMTILAEYPDPFRKPRLITVKGGNPGVYQAFKSGKCEAAIFRDNFFNKKILDADRSNLKIIYKSIPVTNQGFSVSSRVDAEGIQKITEALTVISDALMPTMKRFSPKADTMLPVVKKDDYADQYKLLTGIIIGWDVE